MKFEAPMVAIFHLLVSILLLNAFSMNFATAQSTPFPVRVGVVVDMDSDVGRMRLSCIEMAISDFYTRHGYYQTRLVLNKRDSKRDVVGAAAAALDLLKNVEVQAIIGPLSSMQANFMINLGDKAQVPIITFSSSPSLMSIRSPYFVHAALSDELANAVHQGKFDAAVGDVTILANRSQYVDFTLPYTESGISSNKTKNAWVFLKPLTWKLWLISFCSFVFMGFLFWILEYRINEDFRGPLWREVGTMFLFAFSTKLISNLSRFLLIIWVLVVLILMQSYTASLTSMLTVQELRPTISGGSRGG